MECFESEILRTQGILFWHKNILAAVEGAVPNRDRASPANSLWYVFAKFIPVHRSSLFALLCLISVCSSVNGDAYWGFAAVLSDKRQYCEATEVARTGLSKPNIQPSAFADAAYIYIGCARFCGPQDVAKRDALVDESEIARDQPKHSAHHCHQLEYLPVSNSETRTPER